MGSEARGEGRRRGARAKIRRKHDEARGAVDSAARSMDLSADLRILNVD